MLTKGLAFNREKGRGGYPTLAENLTEGGRACLRRLPSGRDGQCIHFVNISDGRAKRKIEGTYSLSQKFDLHVVDYVEGVGIPYPWSRGLAREARVPASVNDSRSII